MRKSNLITIAAAGLIVALAGGTGAYAAGQIGGDTIQNNTVDTTEVQNGSLSGTDVDNGTLTGLDIKNETVTGSDLENGSVGSADVKDSSIQFEDLSTDAADGMLVRMQNSGQLNNAINTHSGTYQTNDNQDVPVSNKSLVTINATASGDQPVLVQFSQRGTGEAFRCVIVPTAQFGGTCSASAVVGSGTYTVDGQGLASVKVDVVSVG